MICHLTKQNNFTSIIKHAITFNELIYRMNVKKWSTVKDIVFAMGGFQRAGTGKNKKVTEISPLLAFWSVGLGIKFL